MGNTPNTGLDLNAGVAPPVEDPNVASLPTEGGEPSGEPTPEPEGGEPTPEPGTEGSEDGQLDVKEDGRVIPQWMRELQVKNPEAYKKAKADLFELRDRRSVHPTSQAAREEHNLVQSLGGPQGVEQLREDATFFKDAANQFLKGDPAFIKDLWEEDAIAAALHVQPMLDLYRTKDIEGYKATVARLWDNEFQAVGLLERGLQPLQKAIQAGNKEEALAVLESIAGWQGSISQIAKKADDPRVKSLLAERARQHETRQQTEHAEFLKEYRTEALDTVVNEGAKVFDSFFKGRKIDPEDRTDLLREALAMANRTVKADAEFIKQRDKHLERNDSHSALQMTKARFARELPDAVKRVARRYGLISGKPSPGTPPAKPGQQPNKPGQQPGWVAVNIRPDAMEIDRNRTTPDDIISGKAVLKDGRKVTWAHLKKIA
jgi:hypothetical protein